MRPFLFLVAISMAMGLTCACRQPAQRGSAQPREEEANRAARVSPVAEREGIASFSAEIAQLDDNGFSEFLDEYTGETVYLDLSINQAEFQGGQERDFAFFTIYDDCPEDLTEDEKPNGSKCEGTQYLVPKQALKRDGDAYRLTGTFRPGQKSGPNQGLFSVRLDPQP
jgi:hypothetical protein